MFCVLRFVLSFLFGPLRILVCLQLFIFFLQHFKGFATAAAENTKTTLSIHSYYLLWPKWTTNLTRAVEDECTFLHKYVYFTRLPFHFLALRSQSAQLIIPYTKHTYTHAHVVLHMYTCTQKPNGRFFQFLPFIKYFIKQQFLIAFEFW